MHVKDLDDCELLCFRDDNCVSLNIKDKDLDSGTHECELNNFTHLEYDGDLKSNPVYYYRGAKVRNKDINIKVLIFNNYSPKAKLIYKQ